MLTGSTNSLTPFDSNTWSPAPPPSSIIRPYWKPEQPPPCTNTRRPLPAFPSSTSSSLIFDAAVGDTLIIGFAPGRPVPLSTQPIVKLYAAPTPTATQNETLRWRYFFADQQVTRSSG